jgi:hypothetical protein
MKRKHKQLTNEDIEALYWAELGNTPIEKVSDPHFFHKWLKKHNLPATINNIMVLSKVHLRWVAQSLGDVFTL